MLNKTWQCSCYIDLGLLRLGFECALGLRDRTEDKNLQSINSEKSILELLAHYN